MRMAARKFPPLFALLVVSLAGPVSNAQGDGRAKIAETGAIHGQVVNESGQALPNITVLVRSTTAQVSRTTFTDNEGRFRMEGLVRDVYSVNAYAPAYINSNNPEQSVHRVRIGNSVTLTLIKGGVITGRVTNAMNEPLVQVPVRALLVRDSNNRLAPPGFRTPERFTDDRGIYRLYRLSPGTYVVSSGARGTPTNFITAYDSDAPTYAPASTRETAAEITVAAGQEIAGVDISYKGEPGRTIRGKVQGLSKSNSFSVQLTQVANQLPQLQFNQSFRSAEGEFIFSALEAGEYEITAQAPLSAGELAASEPSRIILKNADLTDVELKLLPLGSIAGIVELETSSEPDCQEKPRLAVTDIRIFTRKIDLNEPQLPRTYFAALVTPDREGKFQLRNLRAERYRVNAQFNARYWYLKSISVTNNQSNDVANNGITLKSGERLAGVTIKLAEGAASLAGRVSNNNAAIIEPAIILVPADKEQQEDVVRYFITALNEEGSFEIKNIPPGRYLALIRPLADVKRLGSPDQKEHRAKLRLAATIEKIAIELRPCQDAVDYDLSLAPR